MNESVSIETFVRLLINAPGNDEEKFWMLVVYVAYLDGEQPASSVEQTILDQAFQLIEQAKGS